MPPTTATTSGRTWRQWLAVALAALAALLLIEVPLGARGAKPNERPLYYLVFAVDWVFVRGPSWVGAGMGAVLYALYTVGAWLARLAGPVLRETLSDLYLIGSSPVRGANALVLEALTAMTMDPREAQAFIYILLAFSGAAALFVYTLQATRRACNIRTQRQLEEESLPPPPPPPQASASSQTSSLAKGRKANMARSLSSS
jgi:hypothetical protein